MYHQFNIHKLYAPLSQLRSLFLLTVFSYGSAQAVIRLVQRPYRCATRKLTEGVQFRATPSHTDTPIQHCSLVLMAVTPNVYFLSHDHTFDVRKRDVSDMRSWLDGTAALVPYATAVWTLPAVDTRRLCSSRRASLAGEWRCVEMTDVKTCKRQRNLEQ